MVMGTWLRAGFFVTAVLVSGSWLLYGQDLTSGLPKFYFRVSGNQLDVGVDSPVSIHLRAQDGKAIRTIEAKPDGGALTTTFARDGRRMYQIQDSFDGTAVITLYENDKDKITVKLGKDGVMDFKVAAAAKQDGPANGGAKSSPEDSKLGEPGSVLKK